VDRHACQPVAQRLHEGGSILGIPHRRGRKNLERFCPHGARHGMIPVHHRQRLGHALFVQPPGRLQPTAQPQHGLFVEDRHRVARVALVNHQPDGVGTKIDNAAARQSGRRGEGHR
jgi:hypothetical protein